MASPVFERMFYGEFNKEAKQGIVSLHNVTPEAVQWVLENLYMGNNSLKDVKTALAVYSFAYMYQITGIVELCKHVSHLCQS